MLSMSRITFNRYIVYIILGISRADKMGRANPKKNTGLKKLSQFLYAGLLARPRKALAHVGLAWSSYG